MTAPVLPRSSETIFDEESHTTTRNDLFNHFQSDQVTLRDNGSINTLSWEERLVSFAKQHRSLSHYFDWFIKILGFAAAITFGIYAPLSFKLTAAGNRDNDVAQQEITQQLHRLNEQILSAAASQSLVAVTLADMQDQLAHLSMLRAWEFCEGRLGSIPACAALNASAEVNHVVSEMLHATPASETPTLGSGDQTNKMSPVLLLLTISIPLFAVLYQRLRRRYSDPAIYEPSPPNTKCYTITQRNGPAHGLYALVREG